MAKVVFKQEAIDDLNSIWEYTYKKWSENQADKYYAMLKRSCLDIGKKPEIGNVYFESSDNIFGMHSEKHIIFYQIIDDNKIEVLRILHERMDLKNRINK